MVGNGDEIAGNRCSSCSTYNLECTYLEAPKVSTAAYLLRDHLLTHHAQKRNSPEAWVAFYAPRRESADIQDPCSYVKNLEHRLEQMEKLLHTVGNTAYSLFRSLT